MMAETDTEQTIQNLLEYAESVTELRSGMIHSYSSLMTLAEVVDQADLVSHRLSNIRDICDNCLERDDPLSERAWLAQSVINILDGKTDGE